MLLNKVLLQLGGHDSKNIRKIADKLGEETGTIRAVLDHLCRLEYCEQVFFYTIAKACTGGCSKTCGSTEQIKTKFWVLTTKGIRYQKELREGR